jgi:hypothetical protein
MHCRSKYVDAARLLEIQNPAIERLASSGISTAVDVGPLLWPLDVLIERYIDRFFSPQESLFDETGQHEAVRWTRYFHHVLTPAILANDEAVRNVLRAVKALPSQQPEQAPVSLHNILSEMQLPEPRTPIYSDTHLLLSI